MAEEPESTVTSRESLIEKISEKSHEHDSSSSSDSDSEKTVASFVKDKVYRLFGREKPVHSVFGGGKRMNLSLSLLCLHVVVIDLCCELILFDSVVN